MLNKSYAESLKACYGDVPVREAASPTSPKVGMIKIGETAKVLARDRRWALVKGGGLKGQAALSMMCTPGEALKPIIDVSLIESLSDGSRYISMVWVRNIGSGEFRGDVEVKLKDGADVITMQFVSFSDVPILPHGWKSIQVESGRIPTSAVGYIKGSH